MSSYQRGVRGIAGRRNTIDPRISIVVPALNEALNLSAVLPQLPEVHEVILVDGGSVDGTVQAARRAMPGIITVLQTRTGKGNALAAGFARVTGDIVVMFDADGSADPAEISPVRGRAQGRCGLRQGVAQHRRVVARRTSRRSGTPATGSSTRSSTQVFRTRFTDLCYGYNAFWADLIPLLDLPDHALPASAPNKMVWGDGFEIETVITCRFAAARRLDHRGALDGEAADVRGVEPQCRLRRVAGPPDPVHRAAPGPGHPAGSSAVWASPSSPSSRARQAAIRTSQAA